MSPLLTAPPGLDVPSPLRAGMSRVMPHWKPCFFLSRAAACCQIPVSHIPYSSQCRVHLLPWILQKFPSWFPVRQLLQKVRFLDFNSRPLHATQGLKLWPPPFGQDCISTTVSSSEKLLVWQHSLNSLRYSETSSVFVGQSRFGSNCKILSLAGLTHQFDIYPCYVSEWKDAVSKALFPSYGKASSLTLQIYFNYLIILTEKNHKALKC